jgi:hypothetical protein
MFVAVVKSALRWNLFNKNHKAVSTQKCPQVFHKTILWRKKIARLIGRFSYQMVENLILPLFPVFFTCGYVIFLCTWRVRV